jgi:DNA polymerase III subunit delta
MGFAEISENYIMKGMKLQKFEALEKHLIQAHPDHLSNIYLVCSPREGERRWLLTHIARTICRREEGTLLKRAGLREAIAFVQTPSLFGERLLAIADLEKEESSLFTTYAQVPQERSHLIVGVDAAKLAAEIYQVAMKETFLLDLSGESFSAIRSRLVNWGVRCLTRAGKKIDPSLVGLLVERSDFDLHLLDQEMEKLLCFIGERNEVHQKDLEAISTNSHLQMNGFQLAEQLIEGSFTPPYRVLDLSELLLLLGALRYLFEEGLKVTFELENGRKAIHKQAKLFSRRTFSFFQNGLRALFALELAAKGGFATVQILFDRFCVQVLR